MLTRTILQSSFALLLIVQPAFGQDISDTVSKRTYVKACRAAAASLSSIGLNQEQKPQVVQILTTFRDNREALQPSLYAASRELFLAVNRPQEIFAEQMVREAYQSLSAVDEERVVMRGYAMHELSKVLSPRQYSRVVAANYYLFLCSEGPAAVYWRYLNEWLESQRQVP